MAKPPIPTSNSTVTLSSFGVPHGSGKGRGGLLSPIVSPLMAYRFRIEFPNSGLITQNVVSVEIDEVGKTVVMTIRQTVEAELYDAIKHMLARGVIPAIITQTTAGEDRFAISFNDVETVSHKLRFDYANPGIAEHVVKWKYGYTDVTES